MERSFDINGNDTLLIVHSFVNGKIITDTKKNYYDNNGKLIVNTREIKEEDLDKIDIISRKTKHEYINGIKSKEVSKSNTMVFSKTTKQKEKIYCQKDTIIRNENEKKTLSYIDNDANGELDQVLSETKYYKNDKAIKKINVVDDGKKKTKTVAEYIYENNKLISYIETNYLEGDLKTITNIVTTNYKYDDEGDRIDEETIVKFPPFKN